jgi:hypothetical protein
LKVAYKAPEGGKVLEAVHEKAARVSQLVEGLKSAEELYGLE